MHIFKNRPLALSCCTFAAVAVLALSISASVQIICITASVLSLLVLTFFFLRTKKRTVFFAMLLIFAVLLAFLSSYLFFYVRYQKWQERIGEECVVEGVILKREVGKPYQSVLVAEIHSINGESCRADVRLQFPYASTLQVGDCFRLSGVGAPFESKYTENEETNSIKDGILLCITSEDMENCELIEDGRPSLRAILSRWNFAASYRLEQNVGGEAGKLSSALLLGTRDHLSGDTSLHFRRAGVSHLLALSGLHVSILIAALELFLRCLKCPKSLRSITVFVIAFCYLFLTGASPSTARAVLMLGVLTLGYYCRTDYDPFTSVSVVLAILLLISPNAVLDIGLWLSFVAAGSILIFLPAFESVQDFLYERLTISPRLIKAISGSITAVIVGLAANLALLYLQARFFGELSLGSAPATLLLSVPTTLLLILSVISLAIPYVGFVTAFVGKIMLDVTEWFSNINGILMSLNDIFSQICALSVLLSLVLIAVIKLKRVRAWLLLPLALSVLTVVTSFCVTYIPDRGISFTYVNASGGDLLLFTNKSKSVAIDFSDGTATGGVELIGVAKELRCTELDNLILTHYHNRDTYFIFSMAKRIRVKTLHLPPPLNEEEGAIAAQLKKEAERHGIAVVFGVDEIAIEGLEILSSDHYAMPNDEHDALLFSAKAGREVFTYINGSLARSAHIDEMYDAMNASHHIIVGDTGFSNSLSTPVSHVWWEKKTVLIGEEKVLRFISNAEKYPNVKLVSEPVTFFVK